MGTIPIDETTVVTRAGWTRAVRDSIAGAAATLLIALFGAVPAAGQAGIVEQVQSVITEAGPISVENVTGGLEHPWGIAFLPDGRMLVTERLGNLRIVHENGEMSRPLEGTPDVFAQGQGGLLDVALDPNFEQTGYVYLSYARPGPEGSAASALGRGRFVDDRIEGFEPIFTQEPWITGSNHFGGRIVFADDNTLFFTMADRFQFDPAQDPSNHIGTIVRLNTDGSVPNDNPFVANGNERDEIWSYGHRNIESAALDPATGNLWIAEMGPLGGDELNQPEAGLNYGWPAVSWGINYDGSEIPDPTTRPEFADAVIVWSPVISPSGMAFYDANVFDEWQGSLLVGGLSDHSVVRVAISGETASEEERVPLGARIRDVEVGPDGWVYVLTDEDDGNVWVLKPLE